MSATKIIHGTGRAAVTCRSQAVSSTAKAGYQGHGSFHSDNVEHLIRDPAFVFKSPVHFDDLLEGITPMSTGASLRQHEFMLGKEWTFINHGAFGAPAKVPFTVADRWRLFAEQQPLRHIDRVLLPAMVASLRETAQVLGVGHCPEQLVPLQNVTTGLNAVFETLAHHSTLDMNKNDAVVSLSVGYGSVKHMAKRMAHRTGSSHVEIPIELPTGGRRWSCKDEADAYFTDTLVDVLRTCRSPSGSELQPKVLVLDHITSNTGMVMPLERLCRAAKQHGVRAILVDGAHGPGQLVDNAGNDAENDGMLDLSKLEAVGVDFYTGNFHKWCCAPRGSAFLWSSSKWHDALQHPIVSHGAPGGFLERFVWDGARDYSPQLAAPSAFHFWNAWAGASKSGNLRLGIAKAAQYNSKLRCDAAALLSEHWKTDPLLPQEMHGSMALLRVPCMKKQQFSSDHAKYLQDWLHEEWAIECPVKCLDGELFVRISAHVYNELSQYERLASAIKKADWL